LPISLKFLPDSPKLHQNCDSRSVPLAAYRQETHVGNEFRPYGQPSGSNLMWEDGRPLVRKVPPMPSGQHSTGFGSRCTKDRPRDPNLIGLNQHRSTSSPLRVVAHRKPNQNVSVECLTNSGLNRPLRTHCINVVRIPPARGRRRRVPSRGGPKQIRFLLTSGKDRLEYYIEAAQEVTASQEHDAAMLPPAPTHTRECDKRGEKPANWPATRGTNSLASDRKQGRNLQK